MDDKGITLYVLLDPVLEANILISSLGECDNSTATKAESKNVSLYLQQVLEKVAREICYLFGKMQAYDLISVGKECPTKEVENQVISKLLEIIRE